MDDASEGGFWPFLSKFFRNRSEGTIEDAIDEAQEDGELKSDEAGMLLNVLRFGTMQVGDIMIPRTDIVCIEEDASAQEIAELIFSSGHSRIPIYKENRDSITGIVHAKDVLGILLRGEHAATAVRDIARTPFFISEAVNIKELLQEFKTRKIHLAIALDEYGGTSGLVTFEDVLEVIVGEIEDEHDALRPEDIQRLDDHSYLVSGRAELVDLAQEIGLSLHSEQVETLGGYLTEMAGRVPQAGEQFSLGGRRLTIREADARQVRWVHIQ